MLAYGSEAMDIVNELRFKRMPEKQTEAQNQVACPTCKQPVTWDQASKFRPFCSKRCQLIDLGDWLAEERKISDRPPNLHIVE